MKHLTKKQFDRTNEIGFELKSLADMLKEEAHYDDQAIINKINALVDEEMKIFKAENFELIFDSFIGSDGIEHKSFVTAIANN